MDMSTPYASMPTSAAERDATRRSLCALEPEVLEEVAAGQRDARHLMVLRKPMGGERHKGGVLIDADDPAVDCLKIWLEGGDPTAACQAVVP